MKNEISYVALLRGINVGGHHKVPMADLREIMSEMGFEGVQTLLNTGNVIFQTTFQDKSDLEKSISSVLRQKFGFDIPLVLKKLISLRELIHADPFEGVQKHADIRLYISFCGILPGPVINTPWVSPDGSFRILEIREDMIISVLDLSIQKTPDAMNVLEKFFGKNITTRNWNTVEKIVIQGEKISL